VAFDLLRVNGQDLRPQPYGIRFGLLTGLFAGRSLKYVSVTEIASGESAKRALYHRLRRADAEGIVFKRSDKPYVGSRAPTQVKLKFWATCTALVIRDNQTGAQLPETEGVKVPYEKSPPAKRSVQLALIGPDGLVNVGDCTVVPTRAVPAPGTLLEVRYLYADRASHKLIQMFILQVRTDVGVDACTLDQLKYKVPVTREEDE
jgi:bifunctional non-homologous end joining protein LigD